MMKTVRTKIKQWKLATVSITALLIFFVVACQDQVDQAIREVSKESTIALDLPSDVQKEFDRIQKENPESKFEVIELNDAGKEYLNKTFSTENSNILFSTGTVVNDSGSKRQFIIIGDNEKLKRIALLSKNENDVFTIVDETAKPHFGMETFYKQIAQSIIYPAEARKNGKQGKVFVEFIIETDGTISNVNIAKGVNEYLDDEAIRVFLQTQTKWIPAVNDGLVVKQKLVLPINFILDGLSKKAEEPNSSQTMSEIVVTGYVPKKN